LDFFFLNCFGYFKGVCQGFIWDFFFFFNSLVLKEVSENSLVLKEVSENSLVLKEVSETIFQKCWRNSAFPN